MGEVGFKKAAFGWPYYSARNLAGYASERQGRARAWRLLAALLFWTVTTGAWAAVWGAAGWLLVTVTRLGAPMETLAIAVVVVIALCLAVYTVSVWNGPGR
jgi:hypothetical protein